MLKEHNTVLKNAHSILRPMTENDWDFLLKWNNDPDVLFYSEGDDVKGYTLEMVKKIYRSVSQNAYCFIIEVNGQPIGDCWLQHMNLERIMKKYPDADCRRIDILIGEKEWWGQGIGTEAIRVLTTFGFVKEKADLIWGCDIKNYNKRSIKAFQKVGYRIAAKRKNTSNEKGEYIYDLVIAKEDFF